jgi:Protein of unknown function (DUF2934)
MFVTSLFAHTQEITVKATDSTKQRAPRTSAKRTTSTASPETKPSVPVAAGAEKPVAQPRPPKSVKPTAQTVSPEERHRMIELRAYYRAQQRGFAIGLALDDWLLAEAEVDALLSLGKENKSSH